MNIHNVNLRHFFTLDDIADAGRLSSAAERVHMSQSAVTQALRKLEDTAGMRLFERAGFGVALTAGGAMLVRRARSAINLMARGEREIRAKLPAARMSSPLHRRVTSSQLRALTAVVETGSYSLAAHRLGLAQPTVHRAVGNLEAVVGAKLFPRAAHGVAPKEAAILLARYAELVFAEIRQGFEELWETQGRTDSRIAVGSLPLVRSEFLPTAVTRLLSKYPDARVSILDGPYGEQMHALRHGQIDWLIGALRDPLPATGVVQESLFEQPLVVVVRPGHALLDAAAPTVSNLAELEWVAPQALAPARGFFDHFFEENGINTPTRIIECSSLIATRGLLLQSDRAALLSPLQVREDVAAGELAVLTEAIPGSSRSIGMTVRDFWEPTMVQAEFTRIVRDLAGQVSEA